MAYIEQPYRFVAFQRSATVPGVTNMSPLDETIDSFSEGNSRVREMMQAAESKHGAQLLWIELQELGRHGAWDAVGRFYSKNFA